MSTQPLAIPSSGRFFCPRTRKWLDSVIAAVAGAIVGASGTFLGFEFLGTLVKEALHRSDTRWIVFPGFFLMLLFALVWHELGHVVAARIVGFRFRLLMLGPVAVERVDSDRPLRIRWNRYLSSYGGLAASTPTDMHDLPRRFAVVLAGGPLANLFLSLTLFSLATLPAFADDLAVQLSLILIGIASALFFIISTVPMPHGALLTDGARVLRLWRGGVAAERDAHLLRLSASIATDTPARDWDNTAVNRALLPSDGSVFEWQARQIAYLHSLDRGDIDVAGDHLDAAMDLLSLLPKQAQAAARLEVAYFEAWYRAQPEIAMEWLGGVPVDFALLPAYEHLRATAAIQAALGDTDTARNAVAEALRQLSRTRNVPTWSRTRLIEMANTLGQ